MKAKNKKIKLPKAQAGSQAYMVNLYKEPTLSERLKGAMSDSSRAVGALKKIKFNKKIKPEKKEALKQYYNRMLTEPAGIRNLMRSSSDTTTVKKRGGSVKTKKKK